MHRRRTKRSHRLSPYSPSQCSWLVPARRGARSERRRRGAGRLEDPSPRVGFLAAGARFSCARLDTGRVRCWGIGDHGALGYGNTTDVGDNETPGSVGPVDLGAGRTARAIAAGFYHACAILDQGQVRCWGTGRGRLGYGNENDIGDNETPGSVGSGRPRRGTNRAGRSRAAAATPARSSTTAGCAAGASGPAASSATATRTTSATTRRRARWAGRPRPGTNGGGDRGRRIPHLRDPRQRQRALLGRGRLRPARLREHEGHRRQRGSRLGPTREARPGAKGRRDRGRLRAHLRPARQRQGALLGRQFRRASSATATRGGSATTRRPPRSRPVKLGARRKAIAITASGTHSCAVLNNRTVRCWGTGQYGQLGYGNTRNVGDNEHPGSVRPVEDRVWAKGRRDSGRRPAHLRPARQRPAALLGPCVRRPARLREHEEHRRQRKAELGRARSASAATWRRTEPRRDLEAL